MRTIVTLDDDIYDAAMHLSRASGERLGRVLSMLARRGLKPPDSASRLTRRFAVSDGPANAGDSSSRIHELVISFMTGPSCCSPAANSWGEARRSTLDQHMRLYLTLYPDERTCSIWAAVVDRCRRTGRPIQTADVWMASAARQWSCPLGPRIPTDSEWRRRRRQNL